jgi:hypothetical protein
MECVESHQIQILQYLLFLFLVNRNLLDSAGGGLAFWALGYGFAYGGDNDKPEFTFIGTSGTWMNSFRLIFPRHSLVGLCFSDFTRRAHVRGKESMMRSSAVEHVQNTCNSILSS